MKEKKPLFSHQHSGYLFSFSCLVSVSLGCDVGTGYLHKLPVDPNINITFSFDGLPSTTMTTTTPVNNATASDSKKATQIQSTNVTSNNTVTNTTAETGKAIVAEKTNGLQSLF